MLAVEMDNIPFPRGNKPLIKVIRLQKGVISL
jgi:hypothetical protein